MYSGRSSSRSRRNKASTDSFCKGSGGAAGGAWYLDFQNENGSADSSNWFQASSERSSRRKPCLSRNNKVQIVSPSLKGIWVCAQAWLRALISHSANII